MTKKRNEVNQVFTDNQSPMYKDVPKSAEVARYFDENRKETNRYYDKQYQHQATYSFAETAYVDAHAVCLGESPESVLIRKEARATLVNALCGLTEEQRRRLLLHAVKGWSFERIAGAEGVSADAVRHAFDRTVKRLRTQLAEWSYSDFVLPKRSCPAGSFTRRTLKNREKAYLRDGSASWQNDLKTAREEDLIPAYSLIGYPSKRKALQMPEESGAA